MYCMDAGNESAGCPGLLISTYDCEIPPAAGPWAKTVQVKPETECTSSCRQTSHNDNYGYEIHSVSSAPLYFTDPALQDLGVTQRIDTLHFLKWSCAALSLKFILISSHQSNFTLYQSPSHRLCLLMDPYTHPQCVSASIQLHVSTVNMIYSCGLFFLLHLI